MGQCHRENDEFAVGMPNKDMKFISLSHCLAPDRIFSAFHFTLIFRQRTKSAIQIPQGLFARLLMIHWKYVWLEDWDSSWTLEFRKLRFLSKSPLFPWKTSDGIHLINMLHSECPYQQNYKRTLSECFYVWRSAQKAIMRILWWTRDSWRAFEISLLLSH